MSLEVDGVWRGGLWASTVWADGVWREGPPIIPVVIINPKNIIFVSRDNNAIQVKRKSNTIIVR